MRHLALVALLLVSFGTACNRDSGTKDKPPVADGSTNSRRPPTDYTPSALPNPACGDVGQPCCSDGDGLVCNDVLVCVDGSTCQNPSSPDLGAAPDLSEQAPDLGGNSGDLSPTPDLSDSDDHECACDLVGHGLGLGHCKEQHVLNSNGHGNGHCKYDCQ